jgi:hypothetical protein
MQSYYCFRFWAAILDYTKMQLVLDVGRISVVMATLENPQILAGNRDL